MKKELFIGLMSGTSMDAVDAALVDFSKHPLEIVATHSLPISSALREMLQHLCMPSINEINRLGNLDHKMGQVFAEAVNALIKKANIPAAEIKAIGSHGQTIRHHPQGEYPFTLQIGDPNIIAAQTTITTVADFRRGDMAVGGQGAPLAPAFHAYAFRDKKQDKVVLNLGGIANITYLPADEKKSIIGFDTGPSNTLLDVWAQKILDKSFDKDGQWAASGTINLELLDLFLADPYFKKSPPKSTGREHFNLSWLEHHLAEIKDELKPEDIQATLCELTARSIAQAINTLSPKGCTVLMCGGGIKNSHLIQRLQVHCEHYTLQSTDNFGIPAQWVEAVTFAWLAKQTLDKKPGNLPSVTGANKQVVLGGVYYRIPS